jgi:hypothetical protein
MNNGLTGAISSWNGTGFLILGENASDEDISSPFWSIWWRRPEDDFDSRGEYRRIDLFTG